MTADRTTIFCTTRFEGFHRWADAPDEVAFLRERHRHEFHVEVEVDVQHSDRDVEFILLKRRVDRMISNIQDKGQVKVADTSAPAVFLDGWTPVKGQVPEWSCEHWANAIMDALSRDGYAPSKVEVSEDGENGARVYREQ